MRALLFVAGLLACSLWSASAFADDELRFGAPPDWVIPSKPPASASAEPPGNGLPATVLFDQQVFIDRQGQEGFFNRVVEVEDPKSFALRPVLMMFWDADKEAVTVHWARIQRAGETIDLLAGPDHGFSGSNPGRSRSRALKADDLRKGDLVEIAYTTRRTRNPTDSIDQDFRLLFAGKAALAHLRVVWPEMLPLTWRVYDGLGVPKTATEQGRREVSVELADTSAPSAPAGAPGRYRRAGLIEISEFPTWASVSSALYPVFAAASHVSPASPLMAEFQNLPTNTGDKLHRAHAAERFVQARIREGGAGAPNMIEPLADANTIWSRKSGNRREKAALLVGILAELGIPAQAVLASDTDGLDTRLARPGLFSRVLVSAQIAGKAVLLNPMDGEDRDYEGVDFVVRAPKLIWSLPIQAENAELAQHKVPAADKPLNELSIKIDITGGAAEPGPAHLEAVFRGPAALMMERSVLAPFDRPSDNGLRYWGRFAWLTPDKVSAHFDPAHDELRLVADGKAKLVWKRVGRVWEFTEYGVAVYDAVPVRTGREQDSTPYAVTLPDFQRRTVEVRLPDNGARFAVLGGETAKVSVGGIAYSRVVKRDGGLVSISLERRTVASEFPASEAPEARKAIREFDGRPLTIRTFKDPAGAKPALPAYDAVDAAGFAARGASHLAQDEFELALADFDRAAALEPSSSKFLYDRGVVYYQMGKTDQALGAFNAALGKNRDDALALQAKAEIELGRGDLPAAQRDFNAAITAAPSNNTLRRRRAMAFENAGNVDLAVKYFDDWLVTQVVPKERDRALLDRCKLLAKSPARLGDARVACDAAAKQSPHDSATLEGRGLIALREKRFDEALSQFSELLLITPDAPNGWYGRALTLRGLNRPAEAEDDTATARMADPSIEGLFRRYGFGG